MKKGIKETTVTNFNEDSIFDAEYEIIPTIPYQLCPKCNGEGQVLNYNMIPTP